MMEACDLAVMEVPRQKREEHNLTKKHESMLSNWRVLVGPEDWEDHLLGKEGSGRYRIHNLPTNPGPGFYELGIAVSSQSGSLAKLDPKDIVVTYLGQADNVRTRLQHYGRSGAHLCRSDSTGCQNDCRIVSPPKETCIFKEMFSKGYSIVFRWAPMKNKEDAQRTESRLLKKFDYAWNKDYNGARRLDDILEKIEKVASGTRRVPYISKKYLHFMKQVESSLENNFTTYADEGSYNVFSPVYKFIRSQPRLVSDRCGTNVDETSICGVALGDGSICRRPPVQGRKRCNEHKWRKTSGSNSEKVRNGTSLYVPDLVSDSGAPKSNTLSNEKDSSQICIPGKVLPRVSSERSADRKGGNIICGVELGGGSTCMRQPVSGRMRCKDHKGLTVDGIISKAKSCVSDTSSKLGIHGDQKYYSTSICGAPTVDGSSCKRVVEGNTRCWQHESNIGSKLITHDWTYCSTSICGAPTVDGSSCKRAVKGNTRCWQHESNIGSKFVTHDWTYCSTSICGAPTLNGSFCSRQVKGNTRCWQHESNIGSKFITHDWTYCSTSICGAPTRNGSFCSRQVKGNRRCWQH